MGSSAALRLISATVEGFREGTRHRTLMAATLSTTTGEYPVLIRELSATQAKVTGTCLPPAGVDVILRRRGLDVFATLIWSADATCGLEFETALSEAQIRGQLGGHTAARPPAALRVNRPAVMTSVITDEELATALGWSGVSPVETLHRQRRVVR